MTEVVIVDAVRTPMGRFRGSLSGVRADHLAAQVLNAVVARAGLGADQVDDVILGCVTQIGEQSANIARTALLSAGWPETIPGMTVDRKCGSAEAAIQVAVGQIASGMSDIVVAGGAESMSRVPMGSNRDLHGEAYGRKLMDRFDMSSQGEAAERITDRWELTRENLDGYAVESHRLAAHAADSGWFDRELVPVELEGWVERDVIVDAATMSADETIRRGTNIEKLAGLKTVFRPEGRVTAGNASQITDGAAAVLLMSREMSDKLGLRARACIRSMAVVGADPELMLTGPVAATRKVLDRAGVGLDEVDLFEVNEAFAPVPLMWMKETGVSRDRVNVNGGAIALGHPLGATGARIMTTVLHELERRNGRYAVQSICCNGGMATATLIERIQ